MNTVTITDMMFNTEMIAEDLKGGKEDMTEKRFTLHICFYDYNKTKGDAELRDNGQLLLDSEDIEDMRVLAKLLNELNDENNRIKQTIREAYESERTQIGRNVLKQLLERIE